jgi:phosphate transport system regulatory protein PhoU
MKRHFEEVEADLKERVLHMGALAEEMTRLAMAGLEERDASRLDRVPELEEEVNRLHIEIDDGCFKLLALHQPAAGDLRFVMAAIKINSDLERIGDQAVNVSETARLLLGRPPLHQKLLDIPRMGELALAMLKDSLEAFVRRDADIARSVVGRDEEDVGLDDGRVAQDDVERRDVNFAERARRHVSIECHCESEDDALVRPARRRRHGQLAVMDLVALAVIRQRHVVGKGQHDSHGNHCSLHRSSQHRAINRDATSASNISDGSWLTSKRAR